MHLDITLRGGRSFLCAKNLSKGGKQIKMYVEYIFRHDLYVMETDAAQ